VRLQRVLTEREGRMAKRQQPLRVDAQRNHDAIVAAASAEFARVGSDASLEAIARQAGVGSATLHRRFAEQIQALCDRAAPISAQRPPAAALREWLGEVAAYSARTRGLADAIRFDGVEPVDDSCEAALASTALVLLQPAQADGVRRTVTALQLLSLVNGISIAAQDHADPSGTAVELVNLAFGGIATDRS
jgi:AcrR family transcriptional regulator